MVKFVPNVSTWQLLFVRYIFILMFEYTNYIFTDEKLMKNELKFV